MPFLEFWLTPISILIAAASLFFGIYIYRKQTNIQIFLDFTKRYEGIMDSFPNDTVFYRLSTDMEPPPESKELTLAVLKYLNLCSEEYYLMEEKLLSKKLWNIWKDELENILQSKLVRREWPKIKNEYSAYKEFQMYVDDLIKLQTKSTSKF